MWTILNSSCNKLIHIIDNVMKIHYTNIENIALGLLVFPSFQQKNK